MKNGLLLSAGTTLAVSMALGGIATAEEDDRVLDPIEVTTSYLANEKFSGIKTQTPIIDVPQSLSIVTSGKIIEQGFTDIGDILRYTPGASIGQGEGHRDQITIRGQNTTADFFIDGLRDDVQYFRPLYNLDQVEILRGANAMIFGRGGGGGVINRVTKRPDLDGDLTALTLSADTFGEISGAIDYNTRISGTTAFRLTAFAESLDNHRDQFDGDRFAINPTFLTQLTPDTRLLLSYEHVDDDRVVDRGIPSLNGAPTPGFRDTFFGDPNANTTTLKAHIARARVDHSFSDSLSANATLQYADYDKLYQNLFAIGSNLPAGVVGLDGYLDTTERENLILQANLVADFNTGPLVHTLLVGAEFGDQQTANTRRDTLFEDTQDDQISFVFTDPLMIPAFSFPALNRNRDSDVQFASIYIQDQVDIGDRLKLVGGLRFDQFEIDVTNRDASILSGNDGAALTLSRTDEELSPRIGLIFKPVETVSAYASFSQSFLPRSGDQFLVLTPTTESAAPQEFENTEVGIKWDIRPDLSVTAAFFQLDRENDTREDPDNIGSSIIVGTETEGFEFQINGAITDWWSVDAGYSYLDGSEFGEVSGATAALSQVPENMFSIWNRFAVSPRLGLGLGLTYQDEQFASTSNAVTLPDFTRVDAAAFYTLDNGTRFQLNIENLLDEDYFPAAHNDNNISTGAPLNARFTVRTAF
ncbi:MAG: TonB-dependent siderophore receptor [Pseudomonadota bacterium]